MRGVAEANQGKGAFELLEGPCCDDTACTTRELWQLPGETYAQMVARLTANQKYKPHYTPRILQEAQTS